MERKKALKKPTIQQLANESHVQNAAKLEEICREAINAGTSYSRQCKARPYELVVEPLTPSTPGSSNNGVYTDNCVINREIAVFSSSKS